MLSISDLKIGQTIDNAQLTEIFECSPQGGMRRSIKTNTLVLVSNHVVKKSKIYDDKKIDGVYHYTGMGRRGDQSLSYMQNKTLAESNRNGVDVYFFEVYIETQYIYMGRVKLAGNPYQEEQEDEEGSLRRVWMFPLALIENDNPYALIDEQLIKSTYEDQERIAKKLGMKELRKRARQSASGANYRETKSKTYIRDPFIAEFTKRIAKGVCQLCFRPAPFNDKNNDPYLESHHIVWLSKKGPDTIENTIALCPNCHKRMHVRNEEADINKLLASNKNLLAQNQPS